MNRLFGAKKEKEPEAPKVQGPSLTETSDRVSNFPKMFTNFINTIIAW